MAYDPMAIAQAKSQIIGRTYSDVSNSIETALSQVGQIAKMKEAENHVNSIYGQMSSKFREELKKNNVPDDKATIAVMRYYPKPIKGMDPEQTLQMYIKSSQKADEYLDFWKNQQQQQKTQQQVNQGMQQAIKGGPEYGPPVDTGKGFTEQTATTEQPPATSRNQAIGRYASNPANPPQTMEQANQNANLAPLPQDTPAQMQQKTQQASMTAQAKQKVDPLFEQKKQLANMQIEAKQWEIRLKQAEINKTNAGISKDEFDGVYKKYTDSIVQADKAKETYKNLEGAYTKAIKGDSNDLNALITGGQYNGDPNDLEALRQAAADALANSQEFERLSKTWKTALDSNKKLKTTPTGRIYQGAGGANPASNSSSSPSPSSGIVRLVRNPQTGKLEYAK